MMNLGARSGLLVLFFSSGAAGLGYQMVWVRMFAAGLGHETPAVLAVAGAFLGGVAVGAWFLDRRISRSALSTHFAPIRRRACACFPRNNLSQKPRQPPVGV